MRYASVCSGIESATVAWHPLGWRPAFFAEIDKFPSVVLAHHYPTVPNLGDITRYKDWPDAAFDVLVGGTPCQSFSIAGLRKGLADQRGNLAFAFLGIADRYRPEWLIWENVPGVLSLDSGRAFGSILGGMAELRYHLAYRVLDAQYVRVDGFGRAVPQRRRRVFVVGHLGDWRRAAAVLFDPESLSGNPAPRRQAGQSAARTISARPTGGGGLGTDFDCDGGLIAANGLDGASHAITARHSATGRYDLNGETYIAHALRADGFDASEDGTGRGTPLIPIAFDSKASGRNGFAIGEISPTLRSMAHKDSHQNAGGQVAVAFDTTQITSRASRSSPQAGDPCHPLARGQHAPAIAIQERAVAVAPAWAVRRLTPRECARLQGFPDDYLTQVPWRGKASPPDGPQYKALGNAMAVNVMRWLGRRIEMVNEVLASEAA